MLTASHSRSPSSSQNDTSLQGCSFNPITFLSKTFSQLTSKLEKEHVLASILSYLDVPYPKLVDSYTILSLLGKLARVSGFDFNSQNQVFKRGRRLKGARMSAILKSLIDNPKQVLVGELEALKVITKFPIAFLKRLINPQKLKLFVRHTILPLKKRLLNS